MLPSLDASQEKSEREREEEKERVDAARDAERRLTGESNQAPDPTSSAAGAAVFPDRIAG